MAVEFQDYYQALEVARTASAEEIKLGFRKLARLYHPDVAKNKVTGEAKFKEINEAYEVLGDPEKRRQYDELGAGGQAPGGDPFSPRNGAQRGRSRASSEDEGFEFSGTGFSDFFESYFGGGRGGFGGYDRASGSGRSGPHQGHDVEADLLVSLEEALRGSSRKVTLRRPAGAGAAERTNTYQVRIPPGVREGQRIRLASQGNAGADGGAPGDLYLRVRLARHPDFSVQGADLHFDLDLAPWEAVLGVKVEVPALDGPVSLRVPPGAAASSQLRLRGLGLPRQDGTRGDLYAIVCIRTPGTVSDEERGLWEKLAGVSPFKPRSRS
jgi:curved DNA-binding protein